ncbi:MAG: carboxypeptidase-like regulatory domain-containing protein [Sphingobacteriales bacterium]|nr:carboxypeptidase-like regulatory domain-containing protein [Sphingobacteriales bacterium]
MKNQFLLSFFLLFFTLNLFAQTGDVRGFVYDKDSGEPLVGASVLLQGTKMGLSTDIEGFYSLSRVPVGSYTMLVTFIGYDTSRVAISVGAGQILNQKIYLKEQSKQLNVVEISAEKEQAKTEVRTSTVTLTAKQINRLPSVGGEPDIAQYLQVLPGIVSTGDQGGQLYIRGGSMIQTKVLLDGMTVYNPFHSVGLFSVFETDVIRNVDVMTGGFGAEYGGRISAVIDIATREGNKKRIAGKVAANTFLSKAILRRTHCKTERKRRF